jgi:hypothetical protein
MCYDQCPSPLVNQTMLCVSACYTGYYNVDNVCYTGCQGMFKLGAQCVSQCPSNMVGQNWICVFQCNNQYYNQSGICQLTCDTGYMYEGWQCVTHCNSTDL